MKKVGYQIFIWFSFNLWTPLENLATELVTTQILNDELYCLLHNSLTNYKIMLRFC